MSVCTNALTAACEGVYIEYTASREDGGDVITRRIPTTLPIPAETIELLDLETAMLVVSSEFLVRTGGMLNELNVYPVRRLKYVGGGGESEPGLKGSMLLGAGFNKLESIEFCGVENVRHIPDYFLIMCQCVKSLNILPLHLMNICM